MQTCVLQTDWLTWTLLVGIWRPLWWPFNSKFILSCVAGGSSRSLYWKNASFSLLEEVVDEKVYSAVDLSFQIHSFQLVVKAAHVKLVNYTCTIPLYMFLIPNKSIDVCVCNIVDGSSVHAYEVSLYITFKVYIGVSVPMLKCLWHLAHFSIEV